MKRLVDIEQMDLARLEAAAARANATVPEDLEQRIEYALAAAALTGDSAPAGAAARPAEPNQGSTQAAMAGSRNDHNGHSGNNANAHAARNGRKRLWLPLTGIAAAAAIALLLILPRPGQSQLKDTYDDPELAYAQIEETFKLISSKMADGVALAAESGKQAGKPAQIIDKINRK